MKNLQKVWGFVAFLLHPPNGYLQPICTLVLALAVMSVGATTTREAQNREMCARYMAFIGRDRDDPQRQAALKKWLTVSTCHPYEATTFMRSVRRTGEVIGALQQ